MANDTKELRGDADADLVRALDALAMTEDMTRHAYMLRVLSEHVAGKLHKSSLLHSMLRGNPLYPDPKGRASE